MDERLRFYLDLSIHLHSEYVINQFSFGHWVDIYFMMIALLAKTYLVFLLSEKNCSLQSAINMQTNLTESAFCRKT